MTMLNSLPASICIFRGHGLQTSNRSAAAAHHQPSSFRVMCSQTTTTSRRSGNYKPPTWDYTYLQSFNTNHYTTERYVTRRDELKKKVHNMLNNEEMEDLEKMEAIDELQRMGCACHFEDEIWEALKVRNSCSREGKANLYSTALKFRLLRQNGFCPSQDVFDGFLDERRVNFKTEICEDTKGLLSLYEASFLSMEGETTLDLARDFSTKHLKRAAAGSTTANPNLLAAVERALEMPLHWRVPRLEASSNIHLYQAKPNHNPVLLELAKLDFNLVQTLHQHELKSVSRWWENSYIGEKMKFARDRVVENFFWAVGILSNPRDSNARRMQAKLICLFYTVDDMYDIYGTLDELQVFTDAVERWSDITEIGHLPDYMKPFYSALHNHVNEVAYDAGKKQGILVSRYIRKAWVDLCKSHLQEAKWFHSGYTPSYEEYIENACLSTAVPLEIVHLFIWANNPLNEEALRCLSQHHHDIVRFTSLILRLTNDKATSLNEMKRGDTPKAVECYMNSAKVSISDAQDNINSQINEAWKKMNKIGFEDNPAFSKIFIEFSTNVAKVAQYIYQHGDEHGVKSIFFEPIPLDYASFSNKIILG
ncbi:unnamed protein product [Cuscuta epithymum]|uniref:Uncharacterized protein n=2 Tax=Cuscuta epithymum TaxID=186058 RepID=A0AAV0G6D6_9ASTE|nr:unnamed protein product [Cuscuta epithymum]